MVPAFFNVSQICFTCILNLFYLYFKFIDIKVLNLIDYVSSLTFLKPDYSNVSLSEPAGLSTLMVSPNFISPERIRSQTPSSM